MTILSIDDSQQPPRSEIVNAGRDINDNPDVAQQPLVDWANPPRLADLKQNYTDALPIQQAHVQKVERWLDNMHVRGSAKPKKLHGKSAVQPKLIRKQAEWRYAALSEPFLSTDDLFKVNPVTWEDQAAAQQNELVLNNQINTKLDKVRFVDEYVRAAVDEGTVIIKTGWCFEEEEVTERHPKVQFTPDPNFAPTIQHILQMQQASPSQYDTDVPEELKEAAQMSQQTGTPIRPDIIGYAEVKVMKTVKNHPTADIIPMRNFILDPTAYGDVSKAQFAIVSFESCLSDLRKYPYYKNLDRILLESAAPLAVPDHQASMGVTSFNFIDDPRKRLVVFEYWGFWDIDNSGKTEPIVATWVGNTLIRMEANPYPDKELPFALEHYLPVRKETYGEPDGELLEDNQKILGAVTRGMIDLMANSANSQQGIRKDMLDVTNRRKFEKGENYEFNPQVDPRQGVYMHTYPEIPQSASFMIQLMNQEAESLTGVKAYSQGVGSHSLGDVAAGIRGALDAASKRELGILRRMASGWKKIGRKWIAMNAAFLSEEEVVRITNDQFVTVRRDDLPGNFDLEIDISTAEENNNKAEQLSFMLQTLGPDSPPGERSIILSKICRLRKMPDLAHQLETYQPQPDPMQQQMQQLQMQLLQSEIALNYAKAGETQSSATLHQAKAGTEQVKQGHIKSDTDLKNLDFVEQESGTKQERDLQKIGEQARSNMQLKTLEHAQNLQAQQLDHAQSLQHAVIGHESAMQQKKLDYLQQYKLNQSKK